MRYALGLAALTLVVSIGGGASAQVDTPPNCHWVAMPEAPATLELWCRGDDGRARATGRTLQQSSRPTPVGECPAGKLYDGARCRSEAAVIAAAPKAPYAAPERPAAPTAKTNPPRVLLFRDSRGRRDRGMACVDDRDVTICKPLPRY